MKHQRDNEGERVEDSKDAKLCWLYIYWIWTEKSTTKAIALVDNKIDYMILQRQVIKAVGNQIDARDPPYRKYIITYFIL